MFETEGQLYPYVLDFLNEKYDLLSSYSGHTWSEGLDKEDCVSFELNHLGTRVKPDVFGLSTDYTIIMAEGKINPEGTNLDTAVGQALTYARFSHFSYLFFPAQSLQDMKLLTYVSENAKYHGLGLLLVDNDGSVNEVIEPQLSSFLRSPNSDIVLQTTKQISETEQLLYDIAPYSEDNVSGLSGARAFLVRDFCVWLDRQSGSQRGRQSEESMSQEFANWIKSFMEQNSLDSQAYWRRQKPGGSLEGRELSRCLSGLRGSLYLRFVERDDRGKLSLTELGRALVSISTNTGLVKLSPSERAFFFVIAWKSPRIRRLIDVMQTAPDKTELHNNACGHWPMATIEGKPKCLTEDRFMEEEELSVAGWLNFIYGEDLPGYKKIFWLRSQIFTKGGDKVSYRGFR